MKIQNQKDIFFDKVIFIFQVTGYVLAVWYFRYFFRVNKKMSQDIKKIKKGCLIISNHQSMLDPFIILSNMPFRSFLKILPVRFPISHKQYRRVKPVVLIGGYSIGRDKREKMLKLFRTRKYLEKGRTIMLFPEGKISRQGSLLEFQQGITFLTDVTERTILVKLDGFYENRWYDFWSLDRKIVFSESLNLSGRQEDVLILRKCLEKLN